MTTEKSTVLIEQMMKGLEAAPEPTVATDADPGAGIVQVPTAEMPVPIVRTDVSSAGYYWLYRMTDGKRVRVNGNMVRQKLGQILPDGRRAFSATPPTSVPPEFLPGSLLCLLHPQHADRHIYAAMGLPQCTKEGLQNPFQVEEHVRVKHRRAWQVIDEARKKEDRDEERSVQLRILEALGGAAARNLVQGMGEVVTSSAAADPEAIVTAPADPPLPVASPPVMPPPPPPSPPVPNGATKASQTRRRRDRTPEQIEADKKRMAHARAMRVLKTKKAQPEVPDGV